MKDLTYSLLYTPNRKTDNSLNYICSDNRIHIRFKDYNKEEMVVGFEKKLTYLFTYLINYSEYMQVHQNASAEDKLKYFMQSQDVRHIYEAISYVKQVRFKGFKVYPNYKRKEECKNFGDVSEFVFPLSYDSLNNLEYGGLEAFLNKLNIKLYDYLFNDSYAIIIHKDKNNNYNSKFVNKENKRYNLQTNSDLVTLW